MTTNVITVLGPIAPQHLGITDAHTHAWIEAVPGAAPGSPQLNDPELVMAGLQTYAAAGGGAIVDCQPDGCGRNATRLVHLSRSSGVHIVASTGVHLRRYYGSAPALWQMTAEQACDYFRAEIEQGLVETRDVAQPVKPGCIKLALEASFAMSPLHLFEAAAQASAEFGYAIQVHTERGADVDALLTFFMSQGIAAERLVFCHVDKRPDVGLHAELAQAGVLLEYDTFFRPKYEPEQHVWPLLQRMLALRFGQQIALATDMADPVMWTATGPVGIITGIRQRLMGMGVDAATITRLVGGNIARRLAIPTKNEATA